MAAYEKHKLKKSISTIFLLLFHVCKYILKGRLTGLTNRKHLAGTNTIPLHRYCGLHTSERAQTNRINKCLPTTIQVPSQLPTILKSSNPAQEKNWKLQSMKVRYL